MSQQVAAPALDHLVVLADTLEQGAAWSERVLGLAPQPGGRHALFGTHNRLLSIASPGFDLAYLEIIAVDPAADASRTRWFDMDDGHLRARVRQQGPRLIHWVARVPDAGATVAAWAGQGLDAGEVLAASRMTPQGLLQWKIAVRADGRRLLDGLLPTPIEWGQAHPAAAMPATGLALLGITLEHPEAASLKQALACAGLFRPQVRPAPRVRLRAELQGPRGRIVLAGP